MYPTVLYSKTGLKNHAFYQVDDHHMSIIAENRQMTAKHLPFLNKWHYKITRYFTIA